MPPTRSLAFALAGLLALFAGYSLAQPKKPAPAPQQQSEKALMAAKRDRTHAVLDALTAGDHDIIQREATALISLADRPIFVTGASDAEDDRYKSEEFQFQVEKFKHAAGDLLAAAKAKNLDSAALAYSDLTRTCVKCHTHFRGTKK